MKHLLFFIHSRMCCCSSNAHRCVSDMPMLIFPSAQLCCSASPPATRLRYLLQTSKQCRVCLHHRPGPLRLLWLLLPRLHSRPLRPLPRSRQMSKSLSRFPASRASSRQHSRRRALLETRLCLSLLSTKAALLSSPRGALLHHRYSL